MRRPTGFHGPRHGPARVQLVPKRAEEELLTVVLSFFSEPELLIRRESRNNLAVKGKYWFFFYKFSLLQAIKQQQARIDSQY